MTACSLETTATGLFVDDGGATHLPPPFTADAGRLPIPGRTGVDAGASGDDAGNHPAPMPPPTAVRQDAAAPPPEVDAGDPPDAEPDVDAGTVAPLPPSRPSFPGGTGHGAVAITGAQRPADMGACRPGPPAGGRPEDERVRRGCVFSEAFGTNPLALVESIEADGNGGKETDLHVRITVNPAYADNTYGRDGGGYATPHTLDELRASDHVRLVIPDDHGREELDLVVDYLSEANSNSGFASAGVWADSEDSAVLRGRSEDVLAVMTSLDRNLNACGFTQYLERSPLPETSGTSEWDYRVVYELWIDGKSMDRRRNFGAPQLVSLHASPNKTGSPLLPELRSRACTQADLDALSSWVPLP